MKIRRNSAAGFTLVELVIVLLFCAILAGGVLAVIPKKLEGDKLKETNQRLDYLQESLAAFLSQNGRLPCPADNSGLAQEATLADGACATNAPFATGAIGTVPTRSLQIADSYAYDGWGRLIAYALPHHYNRSENFTKATCTIDSCINVKNSTEAVAVLISYGANGESETLVKDDQNIITNVFVQKEINTQAEQYFDDILRYQTKSQLIQAAGGLDSSAPASLCNNMLKDIDFTDVSNIEAKLCGKNAHPNCVPYFQALAKTISDLCF
jgi:type II secretory pathway pseudopilin PulG